MGFVEEMSGYQKMSHTRRRPLFFLSTFTSYPIFCVSAVGSEWSRALHVPSQIESTYFSLFDFCFSCPFLDSPCHLLAPALTLCCPVTGKSLHLPHLIAGGCRGDDSVLRLIDGNGRERRDRKEGGEADAVSQDSPFNLGVENHLVCLFY